MKKSLLLLFLASNGLFAKDIETQTEPEIYQESTPESTQENIIEGKQATFYAEPEAFWNKAKRLAKIQLYNTKYAIYDAVDFTKRACTGTLTPEENTQLQQRTQNFTYVTHAALPVIALILLIKTKKDIKKIASLLETQALSKAPKKIADK